MINIRSQNEIKLIKESGIILANCHKELRNFIKEGLTTIEIDAFVEKYLKKHNASPEQKGYKEYKFATCTSINDVVCHGVPKYEYLKNGDIITIDMVVNLNGWLSDSAWSYRIGKVSKEADNLLKAAYDSLYIGIEKAVVGNRIGDISNAIQTFVENKGYSVVRCFTGHGIGREMHESPSIPHFGKAGRGQRLQEGMIITIEPMINIGKYDVKIDEEDKWTARTVDGKLSAQYEHTIAITKESPIILTDQK
ncbi:MAG: type I methionyl aminopeptidase [Clostridiales bacterium]